ERVGRFHVIHFDATDPLAFTGAPLSREIYVSSGLWNGLAPYQREAVVMHEMMHLRLWHGPLVRLAEINAACLPKALPAGREFKRSVLLLVELIADDAAARRVGPARYATTLVAMSGLSGDENFDLRARRLASKNWRTPVTRVRSLLQAFTA
ncbi:MAG TPA: M56 family metallopeptidase, partial [Beutenbergiaceae bacterium]|nr:M56 family metallopeptidase [Beutenbergiaceae bacterium]